MNKSNLLLILSIPLVLLALLSTGFFLNNDAVASSPEVTDLEQIYRSAIEDAMIAEEDEICKELVPITESNTELQWMEDSGEKYVLVVTWTKYPESYPVGVNVSTWWGDTWVMVIPELKGFVQQNDIQDDELTVRLEQLIGLPYDNGNNYFVEMWVMPDDLFRPAPDPEITDTQAQLYFHENVSQEHLEWFNSLNSTTYEEYPWTRLGYTYDWGDPKSDVGLSEYVVKENSQVIINSVSTTHDYFDQESN
ncbi:hypothetical protein [Methanococcoides methylutens]|uniref:hypothetical protein n=1 Tax=Methanococcoides methylutens TaxID=2226 RepID=UPI0010835BCA|nr:hypothetical protein [Methanococcoides methylutens]